MIGFWTAEKIEALRVMRLSGRTINEIAAELGTTRGAVIGKADRLKLTEIKMPRFWTEERTEKMKTLHALGISYDDIAAAIGGTTGKAVSHLAARLGLPKRPRNHRAGFRLNQISTEPRPPRSRPRLVVPLVEPSKDLAANIIDVTGCRWAITDHDVEKGAHLFCNHPTEINPKTGQLRPYCPYHAEMNRSKPVPKAEVKRFVVPTSLLRVVA